MKHLLILTLFLYSTASFGVVELPRAIDTSTGKIVSAKLAPKEGTYRCAEGHDLILRRGAVREAHFAHKSSTHEGCGGGSMTLEHRYAQELLSEHLKEWRFIEPCQSCSRSKTFSFTDEVYSAQLEYRFHGFAIDVMVLRQGTPFAALEVYHTHEVDEDKKRFLRDEGLLFIEVTADQVIQKYEDQTFSVDFINPTTCEKCEAEKLRKNVRKCLDCPTFGQKETFHEIDAPTYHPYDTAFLCDACYDTCPSCHEGMRRKDKLQYKRCLTCNMKRTTWNAEVSRAISNRDLFTLRNLLSHVPAGADDREARARLEFFLEEDQRKEEAKAAERIRFERLQREDRIRQWEQDVRIAVESSNFLNLQALVSAPPPGSDSEPFKPKLEELKRLHEERLAIQQAEFRKAEQKQLHIRAKQILDTNCVDLDVPYSEKEQVKRYGGRWNGRIWQVGAKELRKCERWFKEDVRIIPIVEDLLHRNSASPLKKRKRDEREDPTNRKITDWLVPDSK